MSNKQVKFQEIVECGELNKLDKISLFELSQLGLKYFLFDKAYPNNWDILKVYEVYSTPLLIMLDENGTKFGVHIQTCVNGNYFHKENLGAKFGDEYYQVEVERICKEEDAIRAFSFVNFRTKDKYKFNSREYTIFKDTDTGISVYVTRTDIVIPE